MLYIISLCVCVCVCALCMCINGRVYIESDVLDIGETTSWQLSILLTIKKEKERLCDTWETQTLQQE